MKGTTLNPRTRTARAARMTMIVILVTQPLCAVAAVTLVIEMHVMPTGAQCGAVEPFQRGMALSHVPHFVRVHLVVLGPNAVDVLSKFGHATLFPEFSTPWTIATERVS